ncbi:MAG: helix-turn-helix transcriptional regulator [Oscillibacter sp.]|nr:helix-turn-helix transcriptional regulator [Oscillibacter sp.]
MINFKALGKRIKKARKEKGLTQEKFAEMAGIATEYESRIETGAARPSLTLIETISAVLEVDEAEIMFGSKAEEEEVKDLTNKIFSMDKKKRRAVERLIDVISDL